VPGILAAATSKGKKQVSDKSGGIQIIENSSYAHENPTEDVSVELSHSSLTPLPSIAILALAYEEC
jgi:hypothetical protein